MVVLKSIGSICTSAASTVANVTSAADEAAKLVRDTLKIERVKALAEAASEMEKVDFAKVQNLQNVLKKLD